MAARRYTPEDIWGPDEDEQILPRAERLPILLRLLPDDTRGICDRRPELWPADRTGHRRLERDLDELKKIGVVFDHVQRVWMPPAQETPAVDPRLVDVERLDRVRKDVARRRPPLWTDAAALVANLDALLEHDGASFRPQGSRLLREWMVRELLGLRSAGRRLSLHPEHVRRWLHGVRPRGLHRQTLQEVAGIPVESWDVRERVSHSKCDTPEA